MILGAHESAAGGCHLVFERGERDRAQAIQLWTRSSRQWASRPLPDEEVRAFRAAREAFGGPAAPTAAHASYLINLAAPSPVVWKRSVATLLEECRRAERLGVDAVIVHPGASCGAGEDAAIARVCKALVEVCRALGKRARVKLLLEFTAGQGSCIGCSFEQLAAMLDGAKQKRLGVCLDTQHLWAAGVDWTTPAGYRRMIADLDRTVGLERLGAFHLNDSKRPLGARVDRHEVIGRGHIGLAPFGRLLADRRLARVPGYLETPPLPTGEESYAWGLAQLRSLLYL